MEKVIYKYDIYPDDIIDIELPIGAEILTVQTQGGNPKLWALVDPSEIKEVRTFRLAGTGHTIECGRGSEYKYIGTFQLYDTFGSLVLHLFEVL
jgi:hypothetical protein